MINWDVHELGALAVDLGDAGPRVLRQARLVVAKSAVDVQRVSQQTAPVKTGLLKSSIGFDLLDTGLRAEIGPTVEYGHYVEFGTSRMAPRGYMLAGLTAATPGFLAAMADIGGSVLDG